MLNAAQVSGESARTEPDTPLEARKWYVLWTRSHCEQLVHDQLVAMGFYIFLPKLHVWSRRGGLRHVIQVPMFPGYLFLHLSIDKASYIQVCKARGLVRILGASWDRPAVVPDKEVEAVRRAVESGAEAVPHPFLREGQRVRINRGPLTGTEGILVRTMSKKGFLVISIELLQRSVAVEVDCTAVVPA